ncbi:PAS domain-containing protein [Sneathiella marina]|uniref:PAS domain-containing protein n=1 Tax=Sneathiella marina TaxID=2950108 RepID=A0ABY4W536_9PROT|nr:HD domain-containing phosphohydrolase [Sneathiella marina]USG62316.1 PAS domain-containing protein [Sneathiella marina]
MTDTVTKLELNSFLPSEAPESGQHMNSNPWKIGGILLAVLLILSYFAADYAIEIRKKELISELQNRMEITTAGEAKVIETWLNVASEQAGRIVNNELFQLFATEINLTKGQDLPAPLKSQLPYMQGAITSFVQQNSLLGAYMIGQDGRAYLASGGAPSLIDTQRKIAVQQYAKNDVTITPFRSTDHGLVFDLLIPIKAAQSNDLATEANIVGVLLLTITASEQLVGSLDPSPFSLEPVKVRLFQFEEGEYIELFPSKAPFVSPEADQNLSSEMVPFKSWAAKNGDTIYSASHAVNGTSLFVVEQVAGKDALSSLKTYSLFIIGLALSFIIVIISLCLALWLILRNQSATALATQYKDFATQINVQRRLLGSINNTIDEHISLSDPEGQYIYANPSFARLVDTPIRAIPGKTDRLLFGEKVAREMAEYDRKAIATEQTINAFIDIETMQGVRTIRIAKSRFLNDDGNFIGIVTVGSDVTEYVEFQRRKEEMDKKAITVLVRMLEANDPYLADHSNRMGHLAEHIAEQLDLPVETRRIIETSAHLSQIGKISIPRSIREKERRLNAQEQNIMQEHVLVAEKLLQEAEIETPILEAVTQLYERLDGSGYPNGLADDEIGISARILGMADILVARISPRGYRETIGIDEALRVFRNNPEKYDQRIVAAMTDFFESKAGAEFRAMMSVQS